MAFLQVNNILIKSENNITLPWRTKGQGPEPNTMLLLDSPHFR